MSSDSESDWPGDCALITTEYRPSGMRTPLPLRPSQRSRLVPAGNDRALASCRTVAPAPLTTSTVAVAAVVSENEIRVVSATPSPFGVSTAGKARRRWTASGGGPGTAAVHGRTSGPAWIVYVKLPNGVPDASHVQSTRVPDPLPFATGEPSVARIMTVQGSALDNRPVTLTLPPRLPATSGS